MHPDRIAELLEPFLASRSLTACHSEQGSGEEPAVLSSDQLHHISTYIDLLLRWNARINLTAIRDPEEIVTRHFGESLFAARQLFPGSSASSLARMSKVADLGSGAGFPGLPIKLWAPQISLTLVESNQRKATFLREVSRALTLTSIDILAVRAEALVGVNFDVVTLRAVERFDAILPVATRLVSQEGRLALLIGSGQSEGARSHADQFSWGSLLPIPGSKSRVLAIGARIK